MTEQRVPLAPGELAVLQLVAEGLSSAEVAERLGITTGTTNNFLRLIHAKLGVKKTHVAVAVALRHGWIE